MNKFRNHFTGMFLRWAYFKIVWKIVLHEKLLTWFESYLAQMFLGWLYQECSNYSDALKAIAEGEQCRIITVLLYHFLVWPFSQLNSKALCALQVTSYLQTKFEIKLFFAVLLLVQCFLSRHVLTYCQGTNFNLGMQKDCDLLMPKSYNSSMYIFEDVTLYAFSFSAISSLIYTEIPLFLKSSAADLLYVG